MADARQFTPESLLALCERAFPERAHQRLEAVLPINSRQHEVVAFQLAWDDPAGWQSEALIARRYISTISWWRFDDKGKAQREATVSRWLAEQGFPTPTAYAREIGVLGDVVLFAFLPGHDWTVYRQPFHEVIRGRVVEFAELLARLHSLPPEDEVCSVIPAVSLPGALANLTAIAQQVEQAELSAAIDRIMPYAFNLEEQGPVVLHGDYHFSNAILNEHGIEGIIDWEFCAVGDPRWDVANVYMQMVDFDAADSAERFLDTYLKHSGRHFEGPPVYNAVTALQQWAISEWLVMRDRIGQSLSYALAHDLIDLRDVHRRRAQLAMRGLDGE